jgi:hypothetical protein
LLNFDYRLKTKRRKAWILNQQSKFNNQQYSFARDPTRRSKPATLARAQRRVGLETLARGLCHPLHSADIS